MGNGFERERKKDIIIVPWGSDELINGSGILGRSSHSLFFFFSAFVYYPNLVFFLGVTLYSNIAR